LYEHVERLAIEHPPIDLDSVDYTVKRSRRLRIQLGPVLSYLARVELEVQRNVDELETLLPDPPEIDRHFYADVWLPQEMRHGQILDELQIQLGCAPVTPDLSPPSAKIRLLGALAHRDDIQDVCRMLYYLTGMSTERSAVLAYGLLHERVQSLGERAVAQTIVEPIRRQEPGHFAFYHLSAKALWGEMADWQRWLTRTLRSASFTPVGAQDAKQRAHLGLVMAALGIDEDVAGFAAQIARAENSLLWARRRGLSVPRYVLRAFREAAEAALAEP
jgi:hypothetical protein